MNCQKCIDCQRMVGGGEVSWRCYGSRRGTPAYKRDLNVGKAPPRVSPAWCPRRIKEYEFLALIEVSLTVKAETEEEAREELSVYSAEGWVKNGEVLAVADIDLIAETLAVRPE